MFLCNPDVSPFVFMLPALAFVHFAVQTEKCGSCTHTTTHKLFPLAASNTLSQGIFPAFFLQTDRCFIHLQGDFFSTLNTVRSKPHTISACIKAQLASPSAISKTQICLIFCSRQYFTLFFCCCCLCDTAALLE